VSSSRLGFKWVGLHYIDFGNLRIANTRTCIALYFENRGIKRLADELRLGLPFTRN
jgi:hypothetical protein